MLEICVDDLIGLNAALAGGADRVELCSALALGGLTPPESLVRAAAEAAVPVHMLARPRAGDFIYGCDEAGLVARDITLAANAGLAGVVIGASRADRGLDLAVLKEWVCHARDLERARGRPLSLTLHRTFDLCPALSEALESAIELGFDAVLTSGGQPRAIEALDQLEVLCRQSAGRIAIMAGGDVAANNVAAIMATGVDAIHASCRTACGAEQELEESFGFAVGPRRVTDCAAVAGLRRAMHRHSQNL